MPSAFVRREEFDKLVAEFEALKRRALISGAGAQVMQGPQGRILGTAPGASTRDFWAQIVGHMSDGSRYTYSWQAVEKTISGYSGWTPMGLSGSGAYDMSETDPGTDNLPLNLYPVASGRIVRMHRVAGPNGEEFWFNADLYLQLNSESGDSGLGYFWARIVASSEEVQDEGLETETTRYVYSFQEIRKAEAGYFTTGEVTTTWEDDTAGESGSVNAYNAMEYATGKTYAAVPTDSIVLMYPVVYGEIPTGGSENTEYWFVWVGGNSGDPDCPRKTLTWTQTAKDSDTWDISTDGAVDGNGVEVRRITKIYMNASYNIVFHTRTDK
jgi:hypothetical protein